MAKQKRTVGATARLFVADNQGREVVVKDGTGGVRYGRVAGEGEGGTVVVEFQPYPVGKKVGYFQGWPVNCIRLVPVS